MWDGKPGASSIVSRPDASRYRARTSRPIVFFSKEPGIRVASDGRFSVFVYGDRFTNYQPCNIAQTMCKFVHPSGWSTHVQYESAAKAPILQMAYSQWFANG